MSREFIAKSADNEKSKASTGYWGRGAVDPTGSGAESRPQPHVLNVTGYF